MGARITGMDEWLHTLESLPERAPKEFRLVVKRGGVQIKKDWQARWNAIKSMPTHIPHLVRGVGFETSEKGSTYSVEVGVNPRNKQAFLSKIVEYGTLTSAPHPAGKPSLDAEVPKMERYALKVAGDLLEEGP